MPRRARLGLSPAAWVGGGLILAFLLAGVLGPLLAPASPTRSDLDAWMLGPSARHWLGTDENGVDVLSAMLHGARLALVISGLTVITSASIGVAVGTVAGYLGGAVDELVMRVVDVLMAFPGILLNLAIIAMVRHPGVGHVVFALSLNGWVGYARVARGQVLSLRERDYVAAARAVGAGPLRILRRHILPNLLSPLLVQISFGFGGVILVEASLKFLGLGPPVSYSWGAMLNQGTSLLWHTSRLATIPGAAIGLVVLGFNLLGDGLRDRLDPRRLR